MSAPQEPVELLTSTPVELGNLSTHAATQEHQEHQAAAGAAPTGQEQVHPASQNMAGSMDQQPSELATTTQSDFLPPLTIPPAALTRKDTEAIGPSTDLPTPMLGSHPSALAAGPVVQFTLLLASTGTRHPYQINERYLSKRSVKAEGEGGVFDPTVISVYTLKELIWKDWREGICFDGMPRAFD